MILISRRNCNGTGVRGKGKEIRIENLRIKKIGDKNGN
jgi:hypothetical protein